jgi:hypothetical protein
MKKPKMSSLQEIASRLKGKMETYRRSGVIGVTTPAEKQIIDLFSAQQQQVLEIHDAVQAALQIIDDNRPSQRLKRAFKWIRRTASKYWHAMEPNILYRILGALGVVITLWFVGSFIIHHFHVVGK